MSAEGRHGICIPLSSIHTRQSFGIGEFLDLLPLIDWCKEVGFNALQLLPVNETGFDNSPYNLLSSCALNPVYLSLHALGQVPEYPHPSIYVNYHSVREKKEKWIKQYLYRMGPTIAKDPHYQTFLQENRWLPPSDNDRMTQFLLYQQLTRVKRYATEKGVCLIGDIPILVSSQSLDVQEHPQLFDLTHTIGSPPDMFSREGQAWGFPYFKWEEKGSLELWKEKLKVAEQFYHFYRLDHMVGFFRFWKIPQGRKAIDGHYVPHNLEEAVALGRSILERLLTFSKMLPIAEDLGVVLPEFRQVLKTLGIPGMKVMRWERYWDTGGGYIPVEQYEPLSLTCVSTHDTETLEEWWNTHTQESSLYCHLKGIPYRPFDTELRKIYLTDSHRSGSLFHVNLLNEYLALYPELVHDKGYEERINTPGTPPEKNWRYRLRRPLEETLAHEGLKASIRAMLA